MYACLLCFQSFSKQYLLQSKRSDPKNEGERLRGVSKISPLSSLRFVLTRLSPIFFFLLCYSRRRQAHLLSQNEILQQRGHHSPSRRPRGWEHARAISRLRASSPSSHNASRREGDLQHMRHLFALSRNLPLPLSDEEVPGGFR